MKRKKIINKIWHLFVVAILAFGLLPIPKLIVTNALNIPEFKVQVNPLVNAGTVKLFDQDSNYTESTAIDHGVATFYNVESMHHLEISVENVPGFENYSTVVSDVANVLNVNLVELPKIKVYGTVVDDLGVPINLANINYVTKSVVGSTTTNLSGKYEFYVYKGELNSITIDGLPAYNSINYTSFADTQNDINMGISTLVPSKFNITTSATVGGTITPTITNANYGSNQNVEVSAAEGFEISSLLVDGVEQITTPHQISKLQNFNNLTANHSVNATFVPIQYSIELQIGPNGTVIVDNTNSFTSTGGVVLAPIGTSHTLEIHANTVDHYHIGSILVGSLPYTLCDGLTTCNMPISNIQEDKTILVTFEIDSYAISKTSGQHGSINYEGDNNSISHGSSASFNVKPDFGYVVSTITVDGEVLTVDDVISNHDFSYTYTFSNVTSSHTISATFEKMHEDLNNDNNYFNLTFQNNPFREIDNVNQYTYVIDFLNLALFYPTNTSNLININASNTNTTFSTMKSIASQTMINNIIINTTSSNFNEQYISVLTKPISIIVDTTAPTLFITENTSWNKNSTTITGTCNDDFTSPGSGCDYVLWSRDNDTNLHSIPVINGEFNLTINGNNNNSEYHFYGVDRIGNQSTLPYNSRVNVDAVAPIITNVTFVNSTNTLLNYLPFGIFSNDTININVSAVDPDASSGIQKYEMYSNNTLLETIDVSKIKDKSNVKFTLDRNRARLENISFKVYDQVNFESLMYYPNNNSTNFLMVEDVLPVITFNPESGGYQDSNGKLWFNRDSIVTVNTSDQHSGLYNIAVLLNNTRLGLDYNNKVVSNTYNYIVNNDSFVFNTNQNSLEGRNTISVEVVDNSRNTVSQSAEVFKDTTEPLVSQFDFSSKNSSFPMKVLNILTFGTFFNEVVEVKVTATDQDGSGVNLITLFADGVALETLPVNSSGYAIFELSPDFKGQLSAVATDHVGNMTTTATMPNTTNSNIINSSIMLEKSAPLVTINKPSPIYTSYNNEDWYNEDFDFSVEIQDVDSGIREVVVTLNDTVLSKDINNIDVNNNYYISDTKLLNFVFNTNQSMINSEGSYEFKIIVTDNAGNVTTQLFKVYKDVNSPQVISFNFESNGYIEGNSSPVVIDEFGYFFKEDTKVTITSDDTVPSSGVKSITYYTVDYSSNALGVKSTEKTVVVNENNQIVVDIPANYKGQIFAKATDNVNNTLTSFVSPENAILELPDKHQSEEHIYFNKQQSVYKDINGIELFSNDVNLELVIIDTYSGIRDVEYEVIAPYDISKNQTGKINIDRNKNIVGDSSGWKINSSEQNIVTNLSKTLVVSNDSNNILVRVTITDRAGNKSTKEISFSIDKTAPKIDVTYDNNSYDLDFIDETEYYKANRIATVVITERNFNPTDLSYLVTNTDGLTPKLIGWNTSENSVDPNLTKHTAILDYTNDGDYTFDISYEDNAKNKAVNFTQHQFTIDKTQPKVTVTYDNNNPLNGNYYKSQRKATITITEHNFDSSRFKLIGTSSNDGLTLTFPKVSNWVTNGDIHKATIVYKEDGNYSFDLEFMDKAGNVINDYTPDIFVVDQTAPSLKITGVANKSANNGDVIPIITYNDTNINLDKVKISVKGIQNNFTSVRGNYKDIHNGQVFTFANFEKEKELDDIYILTANVEDKAGNKSTVSIIFSVNRFGSNYIFDTALSDINRKFIKLEEQIVLLEVNVDQLKKETIKLKVTKDGVIKDLIEGTDYTIEVTSGESQWSKYKYVINKNLFTNDGRYTVTAYSVDNAGNINENTDETKKAEISFGVDKTLPLVTAVDLKSNVTYGVDSKKVIFSITDNLVLDNVSIYLNNKLVDYVKTMDDYTFVIDKLNHKQNVTIIAKDAAGNEQKVEIKNFYVTTNLFIRWYTNTPLLIISLVALGLFFGFISYNLFKKKLVSKNN